MSIVLNTRGLLKNRTLSFIYRPKLLIKKDDEAGKALVRKPKHRKSDRVIIYAI